MEQCAARAVNTAWGLCFKPLTECAGAAPGRKNPRGTEPRAKPEEPEKKNGVEAPASLLMALALAGGGAFYYIKFVKE